MLSFIDIFAKGYNVELWEQLLRIVLATLLGAVFGFERELKNKPAGFITFMLVSMGSCLFALLQINLVATNIGNYQETGFSLDTSRIIAQVVSGVVFLGACTILHTKGGAKGITTAALLWVSASIGLLIGMGGINNYVIAIFTTIIIFPISLLVRKLGRRFVAGHKIYRLNIVFNEHFEEDLYKKIVDHGAIIKKTFFHTKFTEGNIQYKEIYVYVSITKSIDYNELIDKISEEPYVVSIEDA